MRRKFLFIVGLFFSMHLYAQTGIGTTSPDASAKLDVSSTNKGFLPPRVSLSSVTDNSTISSPATGLLVYCKGDAGLAAGYYYWNGNAWATIATAGGSGSFAASFLRGSRTATQTVAVGGIVAFSNIENSAGADISLNTSTGKITLAAGNTYRLRAAVPNFSGGQRPAFIWYNETTSANIGSATFAYNPGDAASLGAFGAPAELIITPTVSTVVSFRLLSSLSSGNVTVGGNGDFSTAGSYPWFEAQVISGNAPVNGQSVDYLQASLSTNQSLSSAGNIIFNVSNGAGITITSGGFNLIANKTYKLEGALGGASDGYAYYGWVDNTNTLLPGGSIGAVMKAGSAYTDAPQDNAVVYYTPSVNTTVYLRVYNISGTLTAYAPSMSRNYSSSWANITQIGSSAIVNPWTLSGSDVYNTTGKVAIGTSTPSTILTVGKSDGTVSGEITVNPQATTNEGGQVTIKKSLSGGVNDWTIDQYGDNNTNARFRIFPGSTETSGILIKESTGYVGIGTSTPVSKLDVTGDVNVTGKINLTDPSGNIAMKTAAFVNAGVPVTLGDVQVQLSTSANVSLQIKSTSGSNFTSMNSGWNASSTSSFGSFSDNSLIVTGSMQNITSWNFTGYGDTAQYNVMDVTNKRYFRITLMIGSGYTNNFISIERLL